MTNHQALIVLGWFGFKEGEVGYNNEDIETIKTLLDIFKDCDDFIPDRDYTYRQYYLQYMEYSLPSLLERL